LKVFKEDEMEELVHRCDLCGEIADCVPKRIGDREYDLCARCWQDLSEKLKGKGRPVEKPRADFVMLPQRPYEEPAEEPERPLPGSPPIIKGRRPS
jgi:hypothetical protein